MSSKGLNSRNPGGYANDASHGALEPCAASMNDLKNCPKRPEDKKAVVIEALEGSAGPISAPGLSEPLDVVSTTINTQCVGCTSPMLQFTGNIQIPRTMDVTLSFHIVRSSCKSGSTTIGPTYTFSRAAAITGSESFSFQLMDSERKPGIYTYTVELGTNTAVSNDGVMVTEAVLSVIAVCNSGDTCACSCG